MTRVVAVFALLVTVALGADARAERPVQVRSWQLVVDGAPGAFLSSANATQTAAGVEETIAATPGAIAPALWSWIAPAVDGQDPRRTATIVGVSVDAKTSTATQLAGASIRKIVFPALDAADRAPLQIGITLSAAATTPTTASANPERPGPSYLSSNFRLGIDGMPTGRAAAVAPITITMAPQEVVTATVRPGIGLAASRLGASLAPGVVTPVKVASGATVSPVTVKVALADAPAFQQWLSTAAGTKRNGTVQYLDASMKQGFTVSLKGLGITRVTTDTAANRATIELTVDGASVAPP